MNFCRILRLLVRMLFLHIKLISYCFVLVISSLFLDYNLVTWVQFLMSSKLVVHCFMKDIMPKLFQCSVKCIAFGTLKQLSVLHGKNWFRIISVQKLTHCTSSLLSVFFTEIFAKNSQKRTVFIWLFFGEQTCSKVMVN